MTILDELLEEQLDKAQHSSEAKLVATFVKDLLEECPRDYALVISSMEEVLRTALQIIRAAERTRGQIDNLFDPPA